MSTNKLFTNASNQQLPQKNQRRHFIMPGSTFLFLLVLLAVSAVAQNRRVALQVANGQYVSAINGGGGELAARGPAVNVWETFTLITQPNHQVALQSLTGHFVCAEAGGGQALVVNRTGQAAWETFTMVDLGNSRIALRAVNGQYVCAEYGGGSYLIANRGAVGAWETFRLVDLGAAPDPLASVTYGTFSVETFPNADNNLNNTHDQSQSFRDYLEKKGAQAKYALQDSQVRPELFIDTTNWLGMAVPADGGALDAAMVGWHSSHGSMSNNVYTTSMGASGVNGLGVFPSSGDTISSDMMSLGGTYGGFGNQALRYMFWQTCYGIRFSDGNNPYSTWGPRARGIRMILGYDTTAVDTPNDGKYFWEEWEKGKSIGKAFLDASWRIYNRQTPVAMAFGGSAAEASNILANEHFFSSSAVGKNYASWMWYNALPKTAAAAAKQGRNVATRTEQAPEGNIYSVEAQENRVEVVRNVAAGLGLNLEGALHVRPNGSKTMQTTDATLMIEADGSYELTLKQPIAGINATEGISNEMIIEQATEWVERSGLSEGQQLEVGMIRTLNEASGNEQEALAESRIVEKTVIFKQVVNGLAFNDPQAGHLEVSFNPQNGQLMRLYNSLKRLAPMADQNVGGKRQTVAAARAMALRKVKAAAQSQRANAQFEIVADSESVGYSMVDSKVTPVYRVVIQNTAIPGSRPQEVIIPLVQPDKTKVE